MNLAEKILYRRKKAGLSQAELGEKIGVSRQAVSKWETGESIPELGKIVLLADVFQVTTDWLLKDGEAEGDKETQNHWVESVPGLLGQLIQKYGWLLGVYLAAMGALFTGFGVVGNLMFRSIFKDSPFSNRVSYFDSRGLPARDPFGFTTNTNPASYLTGFVIIVGIAFVLVGIALAVYLKRKDAKG